MNEERKRDQDRRPHSLSRSHDSHLSNGNWRDNRREYFDRDDMERNTHAGRPYRRSEPAHRDTPTDTRVPKEKPDLRCFEKLNGLSPVRKRRTPTPEPEMDLVTSRYEFDQNDQNDLDIDLECDFDDFEVDVQLNAGDLPQTEKDKQDACSEEKTTQIEESETDVWGEEDMF